MNSENLSALGSIGPPSTNHDGASPFDTFAVNLYGDVALLDVDGRVRFSTLGDTSGKSVQDVPVDKIDELLSCKFTNIEFNEDGTILLLWSSKCAGILEIPRSRTPGEIMDMGSSSRKCLFSLIGEDYLVSTSIIKASFHPMSSNHVVLLIKGSLLLIDVSSSTGDTQYFSLGIKDHFVSYCFGPSMDWMKFTIFLVSDKKSESAEVFCLCPVIPREILVPKSSVRDLWAWVDEQVVFQDEQNSCGKHYLSRTKQYLQAAFGPRKSVEGDDDKGKNPLSSFVRVGEYALNSGSMYVELDGILSAPPSLQGPFCMAVNRAENEQNSLAVSRSSSHQKLKRTACDISTPRIRGEGAPLIAVTYDNGDVDFMLIRGEGLDFCSNDVMPAWLSSDVLEVAAVSSRSSRSPYDEEKSRRAKAAPVPVPGLLLVETVPVGNAVLSERNSSPSSSVSSTSTSSCRWTLLPDPVVSHCFHVTNRTTGQSYMLSCLWLLKILSQPLQDNPSNEVNRGALYDLDGTGESKQYDPSSTDPRDSPLSAGPRQYPSTVTPVYVPGSSLDDEGVSKTQHCPSAGIVVAYDHFDSFLRHTALFRSSSGAFTAVDLTLHMKLCKQHTSAAERRIAESSSASARALNPSLEGMSWQKVTHDLITQVMEGLRNVPMPSSDHSSATQTSVQCSKALSSVSEHLESQIAPPLQELSRRIRYRVDVLRDTYAAQLELLEGSSDVAGNIGINAQLSGLASRHTDLESRIRAIQERTESQQKRMTQVYSASMMTRTKLSQAERDHREQLEGWCGLLKHMDVGIDALRRQVREQIKQNQSQGHSQGPNLNGTPGFQGGRRNIFSSGSAKKAFPAYPTSTNSYPATPGSGTRAEDNPPMTPQSDSKPHSNPGTIPGAMGYRSPGFGSGPSNVYGVSADLTGSGSSSTSASTSSQPTGTVLRTRKSAYMAQASPASKILSYGSSNSGTPLPFRTVSGSSSTFGSPEGFKSPALSRNFGSPAPSMSLGRFESTPVLSELSSAEVASYEEQLNSQQNILEMASSSLAALEDRVRSMRGQQRRG